MSNPQGNFVWYELMTTNTAAAETFYRNVMGWSARDAGMPGMSYTLFGAGETSVGGMMTLPAQAAEMGAGPSWIGYVWVENVDAKAAEVKKAGGAIYREADDIPGVGRFAIVADPQGGVLALFKGAGGEQQPPGSRRLPGHGGWHELHAKNGETAFPYYAKLFGWTKADAMDMGPMGIYQIFAAGGETIGGMMTSAPPAPPAAFWLYYFNVEEINAAAARVRAGGGEILHGPQEVPGGQWIEQCRDPQSALFALVGPRG